MEAAIVIMALLFFALVALGAYATVKAVRAAKRGVDRTLSQARRTVEDTTLRAKSYGQTGVAGELAQLRLSLRTSMRATQNALQAAGPEDASVGEALLLFQRLSAHGRELDDDLKRLEREPDRSRVAGQLGELRERTERITHSADSLRWAARDRARRFADDDLASLSAQIDIEAGALRHWSPVDDTSGSRPADLSWSEPTAAGAGRERAAAADEAAHGPQGPPRPAAPERRPPRGITARAPRTTAFPWEKTPRPESGNRT
ncbi:hypothetical protein [Streptomyces sp. NPDC048577]|uniref:hypothetical protein n=1 Tax=Streptomyces sp. NPDC048577 TaxID=3157209 RepID=UPI0034121AB0